MPAIAVPVAKSPLAFSFGENQSEGGLWRQLIDKPESWPESSGSVMFAFAIVTGVKNGWLDEKTNSPQLARLGWPWWTNWMKTLI